MSPTCPVASFALLLGFHPHSQLCYNIYMSTNEGLSEQPKDIKRVGLEQGEKLDRRILGYEYTSVQSVETITLAQMLESSQEGCDLIVMDKSIKGVDSETFIKEIL